MEDKRPPYRATITDSGLIVFEHEPIVRRELAALAGKTVNVQVSKFRRTRTIEQNSLLWWSYGEALGEAVDLVELRTGLPVFKTRRQLHDTAKMWLLRKPVETNRGTLDLLGTTTTLNTQEFSDYLERFAAKMADLGVSVPSPNGGR